jgi:hypothetical protein
MRSPKIIRFPKTARRRPAPPPPVYPFYCYEPAWFHSTGFTLLWAASFVTVILYFSGIAGVPRDDRFYMELLAAVWGFYFLHPLLLKVRVLRPLLILAGRLLLVATVIGFFAGIYWVILCSHG